MFLAIVEEVGNENKNNWKKEFETRKEAQDFINNLKDHPSVKKFNVKSEIKNLDEDKEYKNKKQKEKRLAEYPNLETKVDAIIEHFMGDSSSLNKVISEKIAIDNKYPLEEISKL